MYFLQSPADYCRADCPWVCACLIQLPFFPITDNRWQVWKWHQHVDGTALADRDFPAQVERKAGVPRNGHEHFWVLYGELD